MHGDMLHATLLQTGGQAQRLIEQLLVVQPRVKADLACGVPLEQQLLKFYPIHPWPLTRCRTSHSTANSSPISP